MRKYIRVSIFGAVLLGLNSCAPILIPIPTSTKHDPDLAAIHAILFAKEAVVDLNQPGAYDFLSEGMRRNNSLDQFIAMVARMHPRGFPKEVTAAEYETVQNEHSIFIWLYGKRDDEDFYYRLRMEGAGETGYEVAEMVRVVRLPPAQSREPLLARRSTVGLR